MSGEEEFEFREKYTDSVIQLIVFIAEYDIRRPFGEPIPSSAKGSSFVIDAKRGILLTNSHVVENILSVKGLAPKTNRDIRMRLISICREKDLAIVQVFKEDWDILTENKDPQLLEAEFEDTLHLEAMTRVVAIGYPLGQDNIKFTPGYVSGFETLGNDSSSKDEEDTGETVSYIQTTAPINPGNSGGPLVSIKTGKVVGVDSAGIAFAQNVGYAVSTRTIWSCLDKLMQPIMHMEEPPLFFNISTSLIPAGGYTMELGPLTKSRVSSHSESKTKTSPTSPKLISKKIAKPQVESSSSSQSSGKTVHLPNIIRLPQISFTYRRSSDDLSAYYAEKTGQPVGEMRGIYIAKVQKDTVFTFLKEGVILCNIVFQSKNNEIILAQIDNSSKVTCTQYIFRKAGSPTGKYNLKTKKEPSSSTKEINLLELFISEKNHASFAATEVGRKFTIRELIDIIPLDAPMNCLSILESRGTWMKSNSNLTFSINTQHIAIQNLFLHFEPLQYEIIAGLCLADLCMNHEALLPETSKKFLKEPHKFDKHVVVTFVFSDTDANEIRSITTGDIIKTIDDKDIHTIVDVQNVIKAATKNKIIKIITYSGGILVINSDKARRQDKSAMLAYQVRDHSYIF